MGISVIYKATIHYNGNDVNHTESIKSALENVGIKWECIQFKSFSSSPCSEPFIEAECETRYDAVNIYEKWKRVITNMKGEVIY